MTAPGRVAHAGPRWPDLFLAGAAHAGTAALSAHLRRHPAIHMAEPEQPHFFSGIRPARRFERTMPVVSDEAAYRALFADARPDQLAVEASTSYLWAAEAPARMAVVAPAARVVLVLRDPITRAWAHHRQDQAEGAERRGFLRAIRDELQRPARWGQEPVYLGAGFYADGIERFLGTFGRERMLVRFFESVEPDPRGASRELLAWLGLDPGAEAEGSAGHVTGPAAAGATATARASRTAALLGALRLEGTPPRPTRRDAGPVMDDTIRRLLHELYAPDVTRVSELLGMIPPWSITPAL